ncbi:MAG: 2-oxo acid dehydrogenase subunit E2 [Bacteroidales bacterium]|jgi:pyruvate/2-oxoglutarate dehydrogenase complex dihydrolipoamide acyltransferase (E2) component|nr:2-oxo acid dehydrogenase subunit E2 [Bacteroidales bacterium]
MFKPSDKYTKINYPKIRRATIGVLKAARRKNMIHSIIEVDITNARENIRKIKQETKKYISFTGYIIYCVSKAVDENKIMHAYRNKKNQLILFNDVDISTTIERKIDNNSEVVAMIVRGANHKTIAEISEEIKSEKEKDLSEAEVFRSINLFLAIPSLIRQLVFRFLDKSPRFMKKKAGTILVTSANMIGSGAGWGIPVATHTLNITIGGIVDRIVEQNRQFEKRQHLCLTFSFDHDIIDGAPAARFIRNIKKIIESGEIII